MSCINEKNGRKLKFAGICKLTDQELAEHYKLQYIDDAELASVGIERSSLIDDYRHLHELSQMQKTAYNNTFILRRDHKGVYRLQRKKRPQTKNVPMPSTYKFKLLNQLIGILCSQNYGIEAFSRFMELRFHNITEFHLDAATLTMPQLEREYQRFMSHVRYLDNMYQYGDRHRAIDMVVDSLVRFSHQTCGLTQLG